LVPKDKERVLSKKDRGRHWPEKEGCREADVRSSPEPAIRLKPVGGGRKLWKKKGFWEEERM